MRLRIVHALSGGRPLTTAHLLARMPDISKATMEQLVSLELCHEYASERSEPLVESQQGPEYSRSARREHR